ncbi:hypothetical protein [Halarcobacter sp.]|uniref:hypothetical protein n=1 Tax=Halarcobacter sp. TaxID=2321133 RepID=UPI002AABEB3A|nr:hypothetical protein [Halarcobacter sp.]
MNIKILIFSLLITLGFTGCIEQAINNAIENQFKKDHQNLAISGEKVENIQLELIELTESQAKSMFRNTFLNYLNSPVNDGYFNDFTSNIQSYNFEGVKRYSTKSAQTTLFFYKDTSFLSDGVALIEFTIPNNALLQAVRIPNTNNYALIIHNGKGRIFQGLIDGEVQVIGNSVDFRYRRKYIRYNSYLYGGEVYYHMLNKSKEINYNDRKNYLVFNFLDLKDMNDFASIFVKAFPNLKVSNNE